MPDMPIPSHANACLLLADGTVFFGESVGAWRTAAGELCFNTAMTGYQEILTDPSYAGQIITFTAPHIGNAGCNGEDVESEDSGFRIQDSGAKSQSPNPESRILTPRQGACGVILRERPSLPSNFRSRISLDEWLKQNNISGICGIDTRALTRHIRMNGAQNAVIFRIRDSGFGIQEAKKILGLAPDMKGLDLAKTVTTPKSYEWTEPLWQLPLLNPESRILNPHYHVVAVDYGIKHNILRHLAERGCRVTVVPAETSAEEILKLKPDGIFLSNGPGDPAATGKYALPVIQTLIAYQAPGTKHPLPIFGICLGHQLLGLALGGKTEKMTQGHRGANHPVKDLESGKVLITSQNHGFAVSKDGLPKDVEVTHISLFDGTVQGIKHKTKPIFGVQGHPEASPGPHEGGYLFDRFVTLMRIQDSGFGIQEKRKKGL